MTPDDSPASYEKTDLPLNCTSCNWYRPGWPGQLAWCGCGGALVLCDGWQPQENGDNVMIEQNIATEEML